MPVSRQKAEDPSEIVDAPPLNVETLEYTVSQFKKHHEDCALRRKNGISYEIHAEQQRTELLKRKYFDNLRQQQALSGRIEEPRVKEQAGGPFEADHIFDPSSIKPSPSTPDKFHPVFLDNSRLCAEDMNIGGSNARSAVETSTGPSNIMTSPDNRNGSAVDGFLLIKSEPESGETTPTCLKSSPVSSGCTMGSKAPPSSLPFPLPLSGTTTCRNSRNYCAPEAKRKRLLPSPMRGHSFSSTDEMEDDDLKLRAEDCIDGVISTPPIKPLEEGDDPPITPSPTSMGTSNRCPSNPPTNTSTGSNPSNPPSTPTPGPVPELFTTSNSNSTNMPEGLNEFYRVMEQVEEQGRLSSAASVSASSTSSSNQIDMYKSSSVSPPNMMRSQAPQHLLSPPPYHTTMPRQPQPMPLTPSAGYYGAQHPSVPVSHTSPSSSPPFSSPNIHCFNPPLSQQLSSSSLGIQQPQPHPQQQQPQQQQQQPLHTPPPLDVNLQYQNGSLLQQQLQAKHQNQSQLLSKPHQPHMHMSHMTQSDTARPLMTATPLSAPITSRAFSFPHNQAQRIHTSVPSLPPHPPPPHTPTTPLEHYHTFQTTQSARISPTHRANHFHHQVAGSTMYPYGPESSQLPANHLQNPHIQRQLMQSSAVSVSTSSWMQTPGVSGRLAQPRTHIDSLPGHQKPIQTVASLGSYPLQKVGHPVSVVLQPHTLPPTYLPSYGSDSPIATPFPCLSFPPNM